MLKRLSYISPLAVPLLMEMGKEPTPRGTADDEWLLGEAASRHDDLVREATQGLGAGRVEAL